MPKDNLLEEAVAFAAKAHAGKCRKGTKLPYIVHPMEAAAICAGFTDDVEVLAAAVLHDVAEDAGVAVEELVTRWLSSMKNTLPAGNPDSFIVKPCSLGNGTTRRYSRWGMIASDKQPLPCLAAGIHLTAGKTADESLLATLLLG